MQQKILSLLVLFVALPWGIESIPIRESGQVKINGASLNGVSLNKLSANKLGANALATNKLGLNGVSINGLQANSETPIARVRFVTLSDGTRLGAEP